MHTDTAQVGLEGHWLCDVLLDPLTHISPVQGGPLLKLPSLTQSVWQFVPELEEQVLD